MIRNGLTSMFGDSGAFLTLRYIGYSLRVCWIILRNSWSGYRKKAIFLESSTTEMPPLLLVSGSLYSTETLSSFVNIMSPLNQSRIIEDLSPIFQKMNNILAITQIRKSLRKQRKRMAGGGRRLMSTSTQQ